MPGLIQSCVHHSSFFSGLAFCAPLAGSPSALSGCVMKGLVDSFGKTLDSNTARADECAANLDALAGEEDETPKQAPSNRTARVEQAKQNVRERAEDETVSAAQEKGQEKAQDLMERKAKPLLVRLARKGVVKAGKSALASSAGRALLIAGAKKFLPVLSRALSSTAAKEVLAKHPIFLGAFIAGYVTKGAILSDMCMSEAVALFSALKPVLCNSDLCTCYDVGGVNGCLSVSECGRVYGPDAPECRRGGKHRSRISGIVACSEIRKYASRGQNSAPSYLGGKFVTCNSYTRMDETWSAKPQYCYTPMVHKDLKQLMPPRGGRRIVRDNAIVGYKTPADCMKEINLQIQSAGHSKKAFQGAQGSAAAD